MHAGRPTTAVRLAIGVPVRVAYDQWTQFEDFPKFMKGVQEIRQIDDTHLHWKAEIAGHVKEWDAEITEQHPDERVAWKATDGSPNAASRSPSSSAWSATTTSSAPTSATRR